MDWYFGALTGKEVGFRLQNEALEDVTGMRFDPYNAAYKYNPLNLPNMFVYPKFLCYLCVPFFKNYRYDRNQLHDSG